MNKHKINNTGVQSSCGCGHHHDHHHEHNHEHHHEHHHGDCCHTESHASDSSFENISEKNQKTYIIEGLDCANCAAKMERRLQAMPQIQAASITFATKQLRIAAHKPDTLLPQIEAVCRSIEDGISITEKKAFQPYAAARKKGVFKENAKDIISISVGILFFASGAALEHMNIFSKAILPIFILAYLVLGWQVLFTAGKNIIRGQVFDENFLMSIATVAAFFIGEFTEGTGVMLFYRIGELFEHIAVEKSRSQIMDAVDMRPETVALTEGDKIRIIPAEDAKKDDILTVRPGDRIPLDGIVIQGESRVDTSPITGEPVPVRVSSGSQVVSGCVNGQGLIRIKVTRPLSESMVTRILDSVENAAAGKPKMDKFITKFAKIYTPAVVALALLTAIVPSLFTGNWSFWITTAITFLVISCPCALVISVPLAFFSGIGAASKLGILFKGGLSIEALKNIKTVIMDKTGTITEGKFSVQKILPQAGISEERLLFLAASCEAASAHPIAASIVEKALSLGISSEKPLSVQEIPGMGIVAMLSTGQVLCGNDALMKKFNITVEAAEGHGVTEVLLAEEGKFAGRICIADALKEDAAAAIARLKGMGLTPAMLTGDNSASAAIIAHQAGISHMRSQLLPEDKLNALKELREKLGAAMFVGDGINDAPVLAGADVGAAMGSGADAAIEAADVVFMNSSVESIPQSILIAKGTGRIAMQNVIIALAVKLTVILLGFMGFANIWAAVFADTGVAMICILNSLRILWKKFR